MYGILPESDEFFRHILCHCFYFIQIVLIYHVHLSTMQTTKSYTVSFLLEQLVDFDCCCWSFSALLGLLNISTGIGNHSSSFYPRRGIYL